jgi:FAD:protein FMN transferase
MPRPLPALLSLCAAALAAVTLAGCERPAEVHTFAGETMGTVYTVKIAGSLSAERKARVPVLLDEVFSRVIGVMSTYDPESELSRFNNHRETTPFGVSQELVGLVAVAREISKDTGGAFDITVGPLVDAWGFGPGPRDVEPPDLDALGALLDRVGYTKVEEDIKAGTLRKTHPGVACDLSAIAKGYAVDMAAAKLFTEGYTNTMVEVGGEVHARGLNKEGNPWRLAVEKPVPGAREIERVVPLADCAMATSGDYRNFIEKDGRHYSHLIDPVSGRPVTHTTASVTVLHDSCAHADAYATAFMVMGHEKALPLAERRGIAALFLIHDTDGGFVAEATTAFTERVARMSEPAATKNGR